MGSDRKLRDLEGRDRLLAIALLVLVLVPFAVALVRAFRDGWLPSGDEAGIAVRSLDVFSSHPPLTGLPSTSSLYGNYIQTNHPGPIEFYLLAVPLRVLGQSVGPLLTAATINASFVLIALWAFFRRLGLTAMLWAGVMLLAVMWSAGTSVLTDTLSSNMTMYSVLCAVVLTWALIDGDIRLLPLTALVVSYAAQQHLAAGLIVLPLTVVAIVVLATRIVMQARRGETEIRRTALRWSIGAAVVAGVCWLPVAIDQITGHPGNITRVVQFARDNTRATLGFDSGVRQALHAVAPPSVLGRTDTTGAFFLHFLGSLRFALGVAVVVALLLLVWGARKRTPATARLALVALVLLGAAIVNGSNVPASVESTRVNLYRWSWAAAFVTWTALGIGIALLAGRIAGQRSMVRRARQLGPTALLVVAALIATSIVFVGGTDDHNREQPAFALEKRIIPKLLPRIDRHKPLLVVAEGSDATLTVGPYVVFRLLEAGIKVQVSSFAARSYGSRRQYRPRSNPAVVLISSGLAQLASGTGRLIALEPFGPEHNQRVHELAVARSALLDELSAEARGVKFEFAPGAVERIRRTYSGSAYISLLHIQTLITQLPTNPRPAFEDPEFVRLLLTGILRSPVLDQTKLRRLLDIPATGYKGAYGDEQVEVRLLTPDEWRARERLADPLANGGAAASQ